MFGTMFALFYVHRSQRDREREKRMQYWREQVSYMPHFLYGHYLTFSRTHSIKAWLKCGIMLAILSCLWATGIAQSMPTTWMIHSNHRIRLLSRHLACGTSMRVWGRKIWTRTTDTTEDGFEHHYGRCRNCIILNYYTHTQV